jgi:hypothetical protein
VAADGQYTYELRVLPKIAPDVQKRLKTARAANDDATIRKISREAGLGAPLTQSGTITILNGSFVDPNAVEGSGGVAVASTRGMISDGEISRSRVGGGNAAASTPVRAFDQVIADDLIVTGSICVGFDCVDGESFGFDTLRLKENNTQIAFDDTSTSAGFANNDWKLMANDSGSGGASKFTVTDVTAARNIMTLMAAAPADSIFIANTGKVGFRQATPVLDLHVTTSNTPAMRLEQTNAGGFTAQTWDVGSNEANFFVRDVTGGSTLPFRLRPGAPTSSIDVAASGNVGIGTASPSTRLHVNQSADSEVVALTQNANTGVNAIASYRAQSNSSTVQMRAYSSTNTGTRFGVSLANQTEILQSTGVGLLVGTLGSDPLILGTGGVNRLQINGGGGVTITGDLTVTGAKNFAMPDPADANKALYYVALEGPEAGTYFRGSAKTVNGEVVIELPGYFSRITEAEKMTVQLTPNGKWGQMYVASKSPEKLVIKVVEGTEDIEFDYLVQGVRKGYLNYQVERANTLPVH